MKKSASPPVIDWLPTGWTHEKLKSATLADFEALTPDARQLTLGGQDLQKLGEAQRRLTKALSEYDSQSTGIREEDSVENNPSALSEKGTESPRTAKRTFNQSQNASPLESESRSYVNKRQQVSAPIQRHVEILQRTGYESWGFVVIRAEYGDEAGWVSFRSAWLDTMETMLNDANSGITQDQRSGFHCEFIEDRARYGDGFLGDTRNYQAEAERLRANDILRDGLDIGMLLLVDREAMDSFMVPGAAEIAGKPSSQIKANNDGNTDAPQASWVWAIATDYEPDDDDKEDDEKDGHGEFEEGDEEEDDLDRDDDYNGHFKVAVSALFEEFWALLAGNALHPSEMWPLADPIYEGI